MGAISFFIGIEEYFLNNINRCVIWLGCSFAILITSTIWPMSAHALDNKIIANTDKYVVRAYSPEETPIYAKGYFCLSVVVWDIATTNYILPFSDTEVAENFVYVFSAAERQSGTASGRFIIDEVIMGWISKYGIYADTGMVVYLNPQY